MVIASNFNKALLSFFFCLFISSNVFASGKPFKRTLILPGGGFKTSMHLATYHAMVEAGVAPDLIVGICGGAVAAAIIEMFPDDIQAQKDFLLSEDFHGFTKELNMNMDNANKAIKAIGKAIWAYRIGRKRIPDFFNHSIYSQTKDLSDYFNNTLFKPKSENKSFSTIIAATKMKVRPEDIGKLTSEVEKFERDKTFQEAYFTDSVTAELLSDHKASSIVTDFPSAPFAKEIDFITDQNIYFAARSSITDPFLFNPIEVNGHYMLTGASNVLPINYYNKISDKVHFYYKNGLDTLLEYIFTRTFKTPMAKTLKKNLKGRKDFLITDDSFIIEDGKGGKYNLTIEPDVSGISSSSIRSLVLAIVTRGRTIKIRNRIPESYDQYVKIMSGQYTIAKKTVEAILELEGILKNIKDPLAYNKK